MTDDSKMIITLDKSAGDCVRQYAARSGYNHEQAANLMILQAFNDFNRPCRGMGADEPPKELAPEKVHT